MVSNRSKRLVFALSILISVGGLAVLGSAAEPVDGTLKLEVREIGAGPMGWTWGHGVLTYKGESHRFKIDGVVLDAAGAEREEGTGEVLHLGKLGDFEGVYRAIDATGAAGKKGIGVATLRNDKGVHIVLHSVTKGFGATAGPEGVKIALEK